MKRLIFAGLAVMALAGAAAAADLTPRYQRPRQSPALQPGLFLDRFLSRHQRRWRLGQLELGSHRQLRCLRRPDRRHRGLQLAGGADRVRPRRRRRLVRHQGHRRRTAARPAAPPTTTGSAPPEAGSATRTIASCPMSPAALLSATSMPRRRALPERARPMWAGRSAPASNTRSPTIGAQRPSICMSISAASIAAVLRRDHGRQRVVPRRNLPRRHQLPVLTARPSLRDRPKPRTCVRGFSLRAVTAFGSVPVIRA